MLSGPFQGAARLAALTPGVGLMALALGYVLSAPWAENADRADGLHRSSSYSVMLGDLRKTHFTTKRAMRFRGLGGAAAIAQPTNRPKGEPKRGWSQRMYS